MIAMSLLFVAGLLSCGEKDAVTRNDPDFHPSERYVELSYTSNADTLFLEWRMLKDAEFDGFEIHDKNNGAVRLAKDAMSYALPGVTVRQDYRVTLSIVKDGSAVWSTSVTANIDGLDTKIARRIIQDNAGVTGGDGMYSIPLPDGRSVFLMGDSYTSPVENGARSTSSHMFRNTYQIYDNGKVTAITSGDNHSAAVPEDYPNEEKWYWPGHGFVVGDTLYVFQFLMYQGADGMWGFRFERTHLLEYSLPSLTLLRDTPIPYSGPSSVIYGAAALNDGDYLYIYAQIEKESDDMFNPVSVVSCARATAEDIRTKWEYYDGTGWSGNPDDAAVLSGLSDVPVSSQFNVFRLRDKYVLLTRHKVLWEGRIFTYTSDTPYGPWENKKQIFLIPDLGNADWFSYNAMAHPQFEENGRILVSYNVNTDVFAQQFSDVESYRPRFFWCPVDDILD